MEPKWRIFAKSDDKCLWSYLDCSTNHPPRRQKFKPCLGLFISIIGKIMLKT